MSPPGRSRRSRTNPPAWNGYISVDGEWVYYLKDDHGNELGHFMRVPFAGGEGEDLTPDVDPYASYTLSESADGSVLAIAASRPEGTEVYLLSGGERKILMHTTAALRQLVLSADAKYIVTPTNERTGRNEFTLFVRDVKPARCWRNWKTDASIAGAVLAIPGDRAHAMSDASGARVPLIWNVKQANTPTSIWRDQGEVYVGLVARRKRLLLCQIFRYATGTPTTSHPPPSPNWIIHPALSFGCFVQRRNLRQPHQHQPAVNRRRPDARGRARTLLGQAKRRERRLALVVPSLRHAHSELASRP